MLPNTGSCCPQRGRSPRHYGTPFRPPLAPRTFGIPDRHGGHGIYPPQLKELLPQVVSAGVPLPLSEPEVEDDGSRLLFYFLYRYALRGVWSGLVMEKIAFSVYSTAAILALSQHMNGTDSHQRLLNAAVLYSREVEHSPENLELLYEHLCSAI